jgi:hypothetical protein
MGLNKRLIDQAGGGGALVGTDHFGALEYSGNSSTQSISGLDFSPDLVVIKCSTDTFDPLWFDTERGAPYALWSTQTYAHQNDTDSLTSFDSNGFTTSDDNKTNRSGEDYVAWCWKAGGTGVTNTDGNLSTVVRANVDAGFSIVEYTGTNDSTNTLGHGLNSAPELIIIKKTSSTGRWSVGVWESGSNVFAMFLNNTEYRTFNSLFYSSIVPTDSVFTISGWDEINDPFNYIAYCWHSVEGYSKIGTYSGTGSSNSITTGFAPRFVMMRRSSGVGSYIIHSKPPTTGSTSTNHLRWNTNSASDSGVNERITFDSDGFTITGTGTNVNGSGETYIYMAIA